MKKTITPPSTTTKQVKVKIIMPDKTIERIETITLETIGRGYPYKVADSDDFKGSGLDEAMNWFMNDYVKFETEIVE